jgi:hypothetical protein
MIAEGKFSAGHDDREGNSSAGYMEALHNFKSGKIHVENRQKILYRFSI